MNSVRGCGHGSGEQSIFGSLRRVPGVDCSNGPGYWLALGIQHPTARCEVMHFLADPVVLIGGSRMVLEISSVPVNSNWTARGTRKDQGVAGPVILSSGRIISFRTHFW